MQTRKRLHFSATRRSQAQILLLVGDGAGQIVYCSCYDTAVKEPQTLALKLMILVVMVR